MVTLLVKFDPKRAFQPIGFSIMDSDEFKIFIDNWIQQLNSYGEVYMDVYPYDGVYFSNVESFTEAFSAREIFSKRELEVIREIIPLGKTDSFPQFCEVHDYEEQKEEYFDEDEIPF